MLRDLWTLRRYVAGVCVVAVLAGVTVVYQLPSFQARQYDVGIASAHILIDTPSSQVVQVSPPGSSTLGQQANLVASLMVDGAIKTQIAQRAGLRPEQLIGITSSATVPSVAGPASVTAPPGNGVYVLATQVLTDNGGNDLPIISIQAQAPTSARASQLVDATIVGLRTYLNSQAAVQRIPEAHRLQVTGLGLSQATTEARGPSKATAITVILVVFVLGCVGILALLAVVRGWRAASARERLGPAEQLSPDQPRSLDVRPPAPERLNVEPHSANPRPHAPAPDESFFANLQEALIPDEQFFGDLKEAQTPAPPTARQEWTRNARSAAQQAKLSRQNR